MTAPLLTSPVSSANLDIVPHQQICGSTLYNPNFLSPTTIESIDSTVVSNNRCSIVCWRFVGGDIEEFLLYFADDCCVFPCFGQFDRESKIPTAQVSMYLRMSCEIERHIRGAKNSRKQSACGMIYVGRGRCATQNGTEHTPSVGAFEELLSCAVVEDFANKMELEIFCHFFTGGVGVGDGCGDGLGATGTVAGYPFVWSGNIFGLKSGLSAGFCIRFENHCSSPAISDSMVGDEMRRVEGESTLRIYFAHHDRGLQ